MEEIDMELIKAAPEYIGQYRKLRKEFGEYNASLGIDEQYRPINFDDLGEDFFKKDFDKKINKEDNYFYFAKDGDELVGYIYGYIQDMPELFQIGKLGYLDSLIISKDFRGKGYSSKLKNSFLGFLKENNIEMCQIHVAAKNESTKKVYENWGFESDEIRMFKKI